MDSYSMCRTHLSANGYPALFTSDALPVMHDTELQKDFFGITWGYS